MIQNGIEFSSQFLSNTLHPGLFSLSFYFSRPTSWFCGNMLVYRMKFKLFCIIQPILLMLIWREDSQACRDAVNKFPQLSSQAFGNQALIFRKLWSSYPAGGVEQLNDAYLNCCKVHLFWTILVAILLPGAVIFVLEKQLWRNFAFRADPQALTWEGGPDIDTIDALKRRLRRNERRSSCRFDLPLLSGRLIGISFVMIAILWQMIDTVIPSFVFS